MAIKQDISILLEKKMDRGDFLKHLGVAVVAATGFGTIVKVLVGNNDATKSNQALVGYGGSAYGGAKES